jgi:thiopeptide-type bacteriocin biosynthesis protein
VDIIRSCLESFESTKPQHVNPALLTARQAFLAGGLQAVDQLDRPRSWVHRELGVMIGQWPGLYSRVLGIADEFLSLPAVHNFFYMHKSPGLRIRFEVDTEVKAQLEERLSLATAHWKSLGIVNLVRGGVYEPETHLFGGPRSMESVHRLFTTDSLAWLKYHCRVADVTGALPNWAFSLALLQRLFYRFKMEDLENTDIWWRVRQHMGRRLDSSLVPNHGFKEVSEQLRSLWSDQSKLAELISSELLHCVDDFDNTASGEVEKWRANYFNSPDAHIGPRQALAIFTIFHWNRGILRATLQSLIAESLSCFGWEGNVF